MANATTNAIRSLANLPRASLSLISLVYASFFFSPEVSALKGQDFMGIFFRCFFCVCFVLFYIGKSEKRYPCSCGICFWNCIVKLVIK